MNKAVTDGLILMPPAFTEGLAVWSSGNGTPGSPTYDGAVNAAFVPTDPDFDGCLELQKISATQQLRWMGQVPILRGCFLEVRARVKAVSGPLPSVRIAGFAAASNGSAVAGLALTAPAVTLTQYGTAVEVRAIIGAGNRPGVDLDWTGAAYGHVGLDLTGPNGGIVRIDDISVSDVTSYWLRDMMDWVDVRDFGASGDGITDDFAAVNAAALVARDTRRTLLVSSGVYRIASHLTIEAPVRFEGYFVMDDATRLQMSRSFDLPTYDAALNGEDAGLRKGLQALFHYSDHDTFDLKGRRVRLQAPVDLSALTGLDTWTARRCIRNGALDVVEGPVWETVTATSVATYAPGNPFVLGQVANVANVPVGSRVAGTGVGREIYVRARDIGAGTLTLSQPLFGAAGTQTYTFSRFQHMLDMGGFAKMERLELENIEFNAKGAASCVNLGLSGQNMIVRGCTFERPKDKGITSTGRGCAAMMVDHCHFSSNEMPLRAQDRVSVAINTNDNDVKLRGNLVRRFGAFAVMGAGYHIITDNHFFQGDGEPNAIRTPGIVLCQPITGTSISNNYIDNCFVEWTNEYDATPDWSSEYSFGGLSFTGNSCLVTNVLPNFRFLVIKPFGSGHFGNPPQG